MKNILNIKRAGIALLCLFLLSGFSACSAKKADRAANTASSSNILSSESKGSDSKVESSKEAAAVEYKKYQNKRYGFSIEYPAFFKDKDVPINGDGKSFVSDDGTVNFTVSGSNNTLNLGDAYSPEQYLNEMLLPALKNVTLKVQKDNYVLVSWKDGEKIGYTKAVVGKGSVNQYTIKYPASKKAEFDSIIEHLNNTFKTPTVDEFH